MLKLVIDNTKNHYDAITDMYYTEEDKDFPYILKYLDSNIGISCFPTYKEALIYQVGMGLQAETEIYNIFE
jgi:hypothetical protein